MNNFVFNYCLNNCHEGISDSLIKIYNKIKPVIICVGSDLVIGDSLGPFVGTILSEKLKGKAYVYGTLKYPVTAKEINVISKTIKKLHPYSKILAVDAGVGNKQDIGLIKVRDFGIKPGLGVNKNLPEVGDASIIGIVAEKYKAFDNVISNTRLSLIYSVSNVIAKGIEEYLK
jgi:putative sporulation protein YyaC